MPAAAPLERGECGEGVGKEGKGGEEGERGERRRKSGEMGRRGTEFSQCFLFCSPQGREQVENSREVVLQR